MREDLRYIESLIEDIEYSSCPTDRELADFIDNRLIGSKKENVLKHLSSCFRCRETIYEVIEYKKKPKYINSIILATPIVAVVASILLFIYLPQNIKIGKIDLSKSSIDFRANEPKESGVIDGDKFIENILSSIDMSYLKEFNLAKKEKDFDVALDLYQEAINNILDNKNIDEKEKLLKTIIIRYSIAKRAKEEKREEILNNYKSLIIEDIRSYYRGDKL